MRSEWKYRQAMVADDHRAHPCVDVAHRAALLYSLATLLIADGARRRHRESIRASVKGMELMMALLIVGEIGGFAVVFAGFLVGQLWTR